MTSTSRPSCSVSLISSRISLTIYVGLAVVAEDEGSIVATIQRFILQEAKS
jgi:hypothetical protein